MNDSIKPRPILDGELQPKKVRIETPMGNIESDSGNHLIDIGTIIVVMLIFFAMRKFFQVT
tara:strand:- start:1244 stop:1426 length:183 start_codon:yes stop_codon:yes gene_type:complete